MIRVGLLFGGQSAEHEISVQSARNILAALSPTRYEPVPIGITRQGQWWLAELDWLAQASPQKLPPFVQGLTPVAVVPSQGLVGLRQHQWEPLPVDVVFPVLHGPRGEDGTVQGLLTLAGLPFVGAGVLGSAVGMDKEVMKRLLTQAGIPVGNYRCYRRGQAVNPETVIAALGLPVFVKPANLGSSVGVTRVRTAEELRPALEKAWQYDAKVLVEQAITGREIECAILDGSPPQASVAGEIIPQHDFYSYEAKYLDDQGALLKMPADLTPDQVTQVQALSVQVFQVLECAGLGRVDWFFTPDGTWIVNEINTIPGFTQISMYPKLWELSGISYGDLVNRLLELALGAD
ncbi:D-alanyl-alanine synthetase A [Gloeomargarita lithophora Alchichica-D10]|uniref:D-alanine--D-alanine ligase n=1 Tax=Gloeomargarita lithophora Alchichica-D10 TaxID=1188229 RepID=A0A1J0AF15_9CYAN|nr:D-alanine--D-alanine ligase family protein [Gloeomargarita lithophora]APB34524.1 D-alanyl-alanine synthetase A [Gloeomargarita lithophora Alchichica-D10]